MQIFPLVALASSVLSDEFSAERIVLLAIKSRGINAWGFSNSVEMNINCACTKLTKILKFRKQFKKYFNLSYEPESLQIWSLPS